MLAGYPIKKHTHSYLSTPVGLSAWVEIIAAMDMPASALEVFSGSGAVIKLSTGAAGDEDNHEIPYYIIPGGSGIMLPIGLAKGQRLSAKAVGADAADSGVLVLNFFG